MKRTATCLALLAFANAQPAFAAACWKRASAEAAQVKQFDIMLMVSTLRCHGKGVDFADDYNRFVIAKRPVLRGVGEEIVLRFKGAMTAKAALDAYDKMGVVMANKYGNGVAGMDCEAIRGVLGMANDAQATRADLLLLAQRTGIVPELPDGSCEPIVATQFVVNDAAPAPIPAGMAQPALVQPAVVQVAAVEPALAQPALAQAAIAQPAVVQLASLPGIQPGKEPRPIVTGAPSAVGAPLSAEAVTQLKTTLPAETAPEPVSSISSNLP
jgi:hypothetical protein